MANSTATTAPKKQVILGAYVGGVNHQTVWSDPGAGSQIDFSSFQHVAQTAERGKFDFFFLAEGLVLRERLGKVFDHDVIGRPDAIPVLTALAAVTEHLGLIATVNATFNEPYELARQLATLDHLSGGRAGWNIVTSSDAFTGGNFRRGGYLAREDRYVRAEEFLALSRQLWDSWSEEDLSIDAATGRFVARADAGAFAFSGKQFDVAGRFSVPRSPQGQPVILQAGVSAEGREFATGGGPDAIFSPYHTLAEAQPFYRDIQERSVRHRKPAGSTKVLPGAAFVLGDSEADAIERHREITRAQISGRGAQILLETVWNRDLSGYDPDGPLPDIDPDPDGPLVIQGRARLNPDAYATVAEWRAIAAAKNYSLRDLAIHVFGRTEFVGTPQQVADQIDGFVQNDGSDGFIIGSHLTRTGLDEFVDRVVPLLQERGSLRTKYDGVTLRENLGIPLREDGARPPLPKPMHVYQDSIH